MSEESGKITLDDVLAHHEAWALALKLQRAGLIKGRITLLRDLFAVEPSAPLPKETHD